MFMKVLTYVTMCLCIVACLVDLYVGKYGWALFMIALFGLNIFNLHLKETGDKLNEKIKEYQRHVKDK